MNSNGKFIAFEGIDGSGKSTLLKLLSKKLKSNNIPVFETREPTDSIFGSLIHQFMIGRLNTDHRTIAAMFVADRIDHLTNEVNGLKNIVTNGTTVLSDRYYFSSYAYHSVYADMEWVINANKVCADILKPDINIFIDTDPTICIQRMENERFLKERYEELYHLKEVREKYLIAIKKLENEENIVVVDGNGTPETAFSNIWEKIHHYFI